MVVGSRPWMFDKGRGESNLRPARRSNFGAVGVITTGEITVLVIFTSGGQALRMVAVAAALSIAGACAGPTPSADADQTPRDVRASRTAGEPSSDVSADKVEVLAPIDDARIVSTRSLPPQYRLLITSGLPSGCAELARIETTRDGRKIDVKVWNYMPADPEVVCTMIYGIARNTIELGSDFAPGETYRVRVNDTVIELPPH
jgi:hypothetical protein